MKIVYKIEQIYLDYEICKYMDRTSNKVEYESSECQTHRD